jgi:hypothetical protein
MKTLLSRSSRDIRDTHQGGYADSAVVLMIIVLVILHVVFANSIYKAGGFSVRNPLSYVVIGGFLLLVTFKARYVWRFKNSIEKQFKK